MEAPIIGANVQPMVTCRKCKKLNHFEQCCRSKAVQSIQEEDENEKYDSDSEEEFVIKSIRKEILVDHEENNVSLDKIEGENETTVQDIVNNGKEFQETIQKIKMLSEEMEKNL